MIIVIIIFIIIPLNLIFSLSLICESSEIYCKLLNDIFYISPLEHKDGEILKISIRAQYTFENNPWIAELVQYKNNLIKVKFKFLPFNLNNVISEYEKNDINDLDLVYNQINGQSMEFEFLNNECPIAINIFKEVKKIRFKNIYKYLDYIALDYNEYEVLVQSNYEKSYNKIIFDKKAINIFERIFKELKNCSFKKPILKRECKKEFNYDTNIPVPISYLPKIKKISTYSNISLALDYEGNVWAWGCSEIEKVGKENFIPQKIIYLKNIINMDIGEKFALFLDRDKELLILSLENTFKEKMPMKLSKDIEINMFAIGRDKILILDNNGCVYECKIKDIINKKIEFVNFKELFTIKSNLKNIIQITAGDYHYIALDCYGRLYSWGKNNFGQLGIGTNNDSEVPVKIPLKYKVKKIMAGGNSSFALLIDGRLMVWGDNIIGQLGLRNARNKKKPVLFKKLKNIKNIFKGYNHFFALTSDNNLWSWGYGVAGQLGNGKWENSNIPVKTIIDKNILMVSGGYLHSLALTEEGEVYGWGYNSCGQIAK